MTKSLQEILQENRRMILEAVHDRTPDQITELLKVCPKFGGVPALSRVLLALGSKVSFSEESLYKNILYLNNAKWDLTKEDLESQDEETQREIWKLLGGKDEVIL